MNAQLALDKKEHDEFNRLSPDTGVMDLNMPFRVSGNIKIPGPVISTAVNWIHENE